MTCPLRSLTDLLELVHSAGIPLAVGDASDYEALVRHLSLAVLATPPLLVDALARAWAVERGLRGTILDAARAYVAESEVGGNWRDDDRPPR